VHYKQEIRHQTSLKLPLNIDKILKTREKEKEENIINCEVVIVATLWKISFQTF
jgi:hypothetical protein